MPHGAPVRFAQRTAQRPGLMGFSPSLWPRFVARRFGIENHHRRDAGNEYNHSLSRMVKLRRLLVAPRGAAASASRTWPASAGLAV